VLDDREHDARVAAHRHGGDRRNAVARIGLN
jgi:hypothetical protein